MSSQSGADKRKNRDVRGNGDDDERKRKRRQMKKQIYSGNSNTKKKEGSLGLGQSGIMAFYHRGKERGCTHELLSLFDEFLKVSKSKNGEENGNAWIPTASELFELFQQFTNIEDDEDNNNNTLNTTDNSIENTINNKIEDEEDEEDDYDDLEKALKKERNYSSTTGTNASFTTIPIDMDCVMFFKASSLYNAKINFDDTNTTPVIKDKREEGDIEEEKKETTNIEVKNESTKESEEKNEGKNEDKKEETEVDVFKHHDFSPRHNTIIYDPSIWVYKLLNWLIDTKQKRTRFTLRLLPITRTCKANLADINKCIQETLNIDLLKSKNPDVTYAVQPRVRFNVKIERDDIIKNIGRLLNGCKVDLKDADITIFIYIIKSVCFIGYGFKYNQLAKYNLDLMHSK